ncbi:MAG: 6-pyruvoyl-tetrahydropterin synthase-related protein [Terracidiphilus sp.]
MKKQGSGAAAHAPTSSHRNLLGPAIIVLAAAVVMVPQFIRGNSCGHDFNVHLVSWFDCLNAWRHGILYPHWTPSANYGAGEPRFVFYPPLTWMLGAALGALLTWNLAPIALTFIIFAATGLATRALALEALDDLPATLAGCVSIFSGFTLFTGYERCAFPEFAGGFWLPLLILFALRDRHPSASLLRRAFDGSTVPLAIALAGAWLSNLPLGVMAGYLLAGTALLWAIVNKTWAPLFRAAVATVLGLGLAAIYLVPATLQRHWVDISQATEDPGFNFENNWLFSRHSNPVLALHDVVLRQVSWIAVSMIAVALAAVVICSFRNSLPRPGKKWIPLAAIPIVVLFLLFPISRPIWHTLPQMPFLQYPWRWLEAVEAPMALLLVAAIWPSRPDARMARGAILAAFAVFFVAATIYTGTRLFQVCYPEDTVASMLVEYHSGAGFEGMYEYEPPDGDISTAPTGIPGVCFVTDPNIVLGKPDSDDPDANPAWTPDQGTCQATFTWAEGRHISSRGPQTSAIGAQLNPEHRALFATVPHSGYLVLHLLRYPAWSIRLNGQRVTNLPSRNDGLIVVPVAQGPINLTVDWTTSPGDLAGRWLSVLSGLLLISLSLCEHRLARSRLT